MRLIVLLRGAIDRGASRLMILWAWCSLIQRYQLRMGLLFRKGRDRINAHVCVVCWRVLPLQWSTKWDDMYPQSRKIATVQIVAAEALRTRASTKASLSKLQTQESKPQKRYAIARSSTTGREFKNHRIHVRPIDQYARTRLKSVLNCALAEFLARPSLFSVPLGGSVGSSLGSFTTFGPMVGLLSSMGASLRRLVYWRLRFFRYTSFWNWSKPGFSMGGRIVWVGAGTTLFAMIGVLERTFLSIRSASRFWASVRPPARLGKRPRLVSFCLPKSLEEVWNRRGCWEGQWIFIVQWDVCF